VYYDTFVFIRHSHPGDVLQIIMSLKLIGLILQIQDGKEDNYFIFRAAISGYICSILHPHPLLMATL
jgi:hypothetical protein